MANVLPAPIRKAEHLRLIDEVMADRLGALELDKLLIYLIDTVDSRALPYLASQFDVLGYKGWALIDPNAADVDTQRRELIKRAIELHRYKGTPWSIKEAARSIGFGNAEILEGLFDGQGFYVDGSFACDGTVPVSGLNWACFSVVLDLGGLQGITAARTALLRQLINEYKNARSYLVNLTFTDTTSEFVNSDEDLQVTTKADTSDEARNIAICDGRFGANARLLVNGGEDVFEMTTTFESTGVQILEYL